MAMAESLPIIIKKYANRRLYNMQTSCYITISDVHTMIRRNEAFIIKDAKTGKDLTHSVLLQVILELESAHPHILTVACLRSLIGLYEQAQKTKISGYLETLLAQLAQQPQDSGEEETENTRL